MYPAKLCLSWVYVFDGVASPSIAHVGAADRHNVGPYESLRTE